MKLPTEGESRKLFLLTVSQIPGVGQARLKQLMEKLPSFEHFQKTSQNELISMPNIGNKLASQILNFWKTDLWKKAEEVAYKQLDLMQSYSIQLISIWDKSYPPLLKKIFNHPVFIFVRGDEKVLSLPSIGIVGTRYPTSYGSKVAKEFSQALASRGVCIVSGMAYGIDRIAHLAACSQSSPTIGVLASGVDNIYTDPDNKITSMILKSGCVISEEFIGTKPVPEIFPKRNRLISGLSKATLVIESDEDGGSMITAKYALEQNRDIWTVPGNIYSKKSRGTNRLIQDGARTTTSLEDLLTETDIVFGIKKNNDKLKKIERNLKALSEEEKQIVNLLEDETRHIDFIIENVPVDISKIQLILFQLEAKGIIKQFQGKLYGIAR